jgi:predicted nucleic acid-binding protein
MKGLDTPVLLGLLRGESRVTSLLRKWEAEELCTTTINLFELETLARAGRVPGRERRLASLERLRRKLTILPVDEKSAKVAAQEAAKAEGSTASAPNWLILGALLTAGCSEWITTREARFPVAPGIKTSCLAISTSKK